MFDRPEPVEADQGVEEQARVELAARQAGVLAQLREIEEKRKAGGS